MPERRGDHPEEDEDQDRAAERARLGPLQDALPQRLGLSLPPRLREAAGSLVVLTVSSTLAPPAAGRPPVGGRLH